MAAANLDRFRPLEGFLARLDGVRAYRDGHIAKCPAHADRTASLSVKELPDGRILLHCFAGCPAAAVTDAVGLTLSDLFPQSMAASMDNATPAERKRARTEARRFAVQSQWGAALNVLASEAIVVVVACESLCNGGALCDEDRGRLHLAYQRISDAQGVLNVRA